MVTGQQGTPCNNIRGRLHGTFKSQAQKRMMTNVGANQETMSQISKVFERHLLKFCN